VVAEAALVGGGGLFLLRVTGDQGRVDVQDQAGQLTSQGLPNADDSHLFLKNKVTPPAYLSCGTPTWTCSTVDYKAGTRAHIESMGYTSAS